MPDPAQDPGTDKMRITYAFRPAVIGLAIAATLVIFLVTRTEYKSNDVVAVVGLFTSVLGTLVGAFFGLQIGSAGKERAQQEAQDAHRLAQKALARLSPMTLKRSLVKTWQNVAHFLKRKN